MVILNFSYKFIFLGILLSIINSDLTYDINVLNKDTSSKDNNGQIQKCGVIYLSINAYSRKLVMNWYYHICNRLPDTLILHRTTNSSIKDESLDVIKIKSNKYGSHETNFTWNSHDFPGNWSIENPNPQKKFYICSLYYIASYRQRVQEDSKCLRVNPNWMARFSKLRLHKIFIPGTYYSGAIGGHQHYDFWGQLVFGIRYFDIRVGVGRESKYNTWPYQVTRAGSLPEELEKVKIFLKRTKKEIIFLDFREFIRFNDSYHDKLVQSLKEHFKNAMAPANLSSMSIKEGGPTLKYLLDHKYRIIINYRHPKTVKRYDFLWNQIQKKKCRSDDNYKVWNCLHDLGKNHTHKKLLCSIIPALKSLDQTDVKNNAISANLSRWLALGNLNQHINIISVDYFESTNIVVDAYKTNKKKANLHDLY